MLNSPWKGLVSTFAASWIALTMPLLWIGFEIEQDDRQHDQQENQPGGDSDEPRQPQE
jgi:hypothetical protein